MADDDNAADAREENHEADAIAAVADEVARAIVEKFPGSIAVDSHGQSVVFIDRARLCEVAQFLRDEQEFTMCLDVTAVDHLLTGPRWSARGVAQQRLEIVVNFL